MDKGADVLWFKLFIINELLTASLQCSTGCENKPVEDCRLAAESSLITNNLNQRTSASLLITPPARRAWRSYKFASLGFSGFFSVSEVGVPLMGNTAGTKLHEPI